jgi:8-oxo-dGTP diphosphatase
VTERTVDSEKQVEEEEILTTPITLMVDVVIFSLRPKNEAQPVGEIRPDEAAELLELQVLLVKRARDPFCGQWSLPGGIVRPTESLEQSAARHLTEKTALHPAYLEQLFSFGQPERDPRRRTVSIAYFALVRTDNQRISAGRNTSEARWFPADALPQPLAFDHPHILNYALWRLRNKIKYANIAFQFLPPSFTLSQLRAVYELITGKKEDPANFKRKVDASGTIIETAARLEGGRHRPPKLYKAVVTQADPYQRGPVY